MLLPYTESIEQAMKCVFGQLSEQGRRLYAAVEAQKLPRGGQHYIAELLGCTAKTLRRGLRELTNPAALPAAGRIRHPGGGRKRLLDQAPELDAQFEQVLREHTAGDPMNGDIHWTNLTAGQIAAQLSTAHGQPVGVHVVKQLLKRHKYVRRKARKCKRLGDSADRDAQFENIRKLKAQYTALGWPIISMDTKKKELLGDLYRDGQLYTQEVIEVFDHDFPYLATGVVIPYTIYDLQQHTAYVYLGTSKDTAEFVCDCVAHWWTHYGQARYPGVPSILALADGGGSNSARHFIFKANLQHLADQLGVTIRLAHYPPYCSKWNPVEHRVFPHLTRALSGVILTSHTQTKTLLERATTRTGLRVVAHLWDKVYETGRKVAADFKETMRIVFDAHLGQWNYCAVPTPPDSG
jgi:hypothetical protein